MASPVLSINAAGRKLPTLGPVFANKLTTHHRKGKTMKTKVSSSWILSLLLITCVLCATTARGHDSDLPIQLAGMRAAAHVTRDTLGIAHINARNEHDLFFLQGYVHAQDRLFQMDMNRRIGSGTLAELLGEGALPTDVQLRTIGLHRAAERSFAAPSRRAPAALQAYTAGVNAFANSNPLPIEYGALELTQFQPWTPVDTLTVAKLVAFERSFDLDIAPTITLMTYQQPGQALRFDGVALYFERLFRSARF